MGDGSDPVIGMCKWFVSTNHAIIYTIDAHYLLAECIWDMEWAGSVEIEWDSVSRTQLTAGGHTHWPHHAVTLVAKSGRS